MILNCAENMKYTKSVYCYFIIVSVENADAAEDQCKNLN